MAHPKGLLMERLKKLGVGKPDFRTVNTGPEHQPTFLSDVLVEGEVYGTGQGSNKREAERLAAEEALSYIERNPMEFDGQEVAEEPTESVPGRRPQEPRREAAEDGRFEGPWPVFEHLLATSLQVAHGRVDDRLGGEEARAAVRDFALELYKDLLEDLGDVVEIGDDEES
jgi:hypothetical protein